MNDACIGLVAICAAFFVLKALADIERHEQRKSEDRFIAALERQIKDKVRL